MMDHFQEAFPPAELFGPWGRRKQNKKTKQEPVKSDRTHLFTNIHKTTRSKSSQDVTPPSLDLLFTCRHTIKTFDICLSCLRGNHAHCKSVSLWKHEHVNIRQLFLEGIADAQRNEINSENLHSVWFLRTLSCHLISPQSVMTTFFNTPPSCKPYDSIFVTTSMPSFTCPNTTCLPSSLQMTTQR